MKTALKGENEDFSGMTHKHVSGPIGIGNRPRSPKLWVITYENSPKMRK